MHRSLWVLVALAGCNGDGDPECSTFDEVFVWVDSDGDGFGRDEQIGYVCTPAAGQATNNVDCDDDEAAVHPGAEEVCDLLDNDCNTVVDDGFAKIPWYEDADGDGVGSTESQVDAQCQPPPGSWSTIPGDCDDSDPAVNPVAIERCNGFDDDCDGAIDDDDAGVDPTSYTSWSPDADGDGYGDRDFVIDSCSPPDPDAIEDSTDCDDGNPAISPGELEVCDGIDNDCDDLVDDADPSVDSSTQTLYQADFDGDGYGNPITTEYACVPTPGVAVDNDLDCDDFDPLVNIPQDWYYDEDGDGWGIAPSLGFDCFPPAPDSGPFLGDCEETNPDVSPGTPEDCFDGEDQNCNGDIDCMDADCADDPGCIEPCADYVLFGAPPITDSGSTVGAGDQLVPSCGLGTSPDVVVQWVAPAAGIYTIDLAGSGYDTVLAVYDGCKGAELDCNDDFFGLQSRVQVTASAGQVLMIAIDGFLGASGNYVLHIN